MKWWPFSNEHDRNTRLLGARHEILELAELAQAEGKKLRAHGDKTGHARMIAKSSAYLHAATIIANASRP